MGEGISKLVAAAVWTCTGREWNRQQLLGGFWRRVREPCNWIDAEDRQTICSCLLWSFIWDLLGLPGHVGCNSTVKILLNDQCVGLLIDVAQSQDGPQQTEGSTCHGQRSNHLVSPFTYCKLGVTQVLGQYDHFFPRLLMHIKDFFLQHGPFVLVHSHVETWFPARAHADNSWPESSCRRSKQFTDLVCSE